MSIPITGLFAPSGGPDAFNLVTWHDVANHNFVATDPPGVDNDLNDATEPTNPEGYRVGSFWCDIVHGKVYVCLDPADGAAVWVEITAAGGTGGGLSGIDFAANGDPLCFAAALGLQEGTGVWISGTCVGGEAAYTVGAYPTALPTSISGVDLKLENGLVCFARALDFHQGAGIWISGTCAGQEGEFTFGAYPAAAAPTSISGVDVLVRDGEVCFARALDFHEGSGVWISGTCSGPEATVEVGAYPAAAPPTSISGVDARLDGGPVCFARAFDFHQTSTVWISGSCSGQEADYTFGAYPSAAGGTSISGVDAKVENAALCFARAFDFHAGAGLWISGTCANQEAEITIGARRPIMDSFFLV